ncbi:MAG: hypothetical protein U0V74_07195 [Chitinophagales bacterium]
MDISVYISEMLFEHDCIIIPGFGGLVCNYKSADIHPILHTIQPPTKAITFNRNLQTNDGLLVNYISAKGKMTLDTASSLVSDWVSSAKTLLRNNEEINIARVGKLHADIEGNLQFQQDEATNYLKAAYGLRTIVAEPVLRGKQIDFTEKFTQETKKQVSGRKQWRVAAVIVILIAMAAIGQLMWAGVEVKALRLDEAGIYNTISSIFKTPEPEFHPMPVEQKQEVVSEDTFTETSNTSTDTLPLTPDPTLTADNNVPAVKEEVEVKENPVVEQPVITSGNGHTYYVIIGAFREDQNIDAAVERLQQRFPDSIIFREKGARLTKIGYSVGNHFYEAQRRLEDAQQEDPTFWLLKK